MVPRGPACGEEAETLAGRATQPGPSAGVDAVAACLGGVETWASDTCSHMADAPPGVVFCPNVYFKNYVCVSGEVPTVCA